MWQTAEEVGLSKEEIFKICEKLIKKERKNSKRVCPDCAVQVEQPHIDGCDVARCLRCGGQALSCKCKTAANDIWTGMWPGIQECYDKKLISRFGNKAEWGFDLNTEARLRIESKKNKLK